MYLSYHYLKRINEDDLRKLSVVPLLRLSIILLSDLKEAHDRLNRNSQKSSQLPSTQELMQSVDTV